jgi:hypothetical protein
MDLSVTDLVERLKGTATRVGTQGVRMLVEGTVAAVRAVDEFQALLAKQRQLRVKHEPAQEVGPERLWMEEPTLARPTPARPVRTRAKEVPSEQARATAELVLEEARAAEERIKQARPARRPLKIQGEDEEPRTPRKTARTTGRKTLATATSPKRVTAKSGFKAKRGQKHRH